MHHGFITVAAATPRLRVADVAYNAQGILALMREADAQKVKVLLCPELCLTAATCGDFFLHSTLVHGAWDQLLFLAKQSAALDVLTCIGLPVRVGSHLYNACAFVQHGRVLGIQAATQLDAMAKRVFCDESVSTTLLIDGMEMPFGANLQLACQDIPDLVVAASIGQDFFSPTPICQAHIAGGATLLLHPSAKPHILGSQASLRRDLLAQSARYACAYLHAGAGAGESSTDFVYAGARFVVENGEVLDEGPLYTTGLTLSQIDVQLLASLRKQNAVNMRVTDAITVPFSLRMEETSLTRHFTPSPFVPNDAAVLSALCDEVLAIQAEGLKTRLAHLHMKKMVLGLSGGLDSTLAALICVRALDDLGLPRKNVHAISLPCFGTSGRTRNNAQLLAEALGAHMETIDIAPAVTAHLKDISHGGALDVTYENAQARERTQVLMDVAGREGSLVIGTGDLSELALGFATYNGDHMSMYGVNATIPKTLIFALVEHVAGLEDHLHDVLIDIVNTPVSPELLPPNEGEISQKTEEFLGPYALHDFFLYHFLHNHFSPSKILRLAQCAFMGVYDEEEILRCLRLFLRRFFAQQYKRSCLPDGPCALPVSLSPRAGFFAPSDAIAQLWLAQLPPEPKR